MERLLKRALLSAYFVLSGVCALNGQENAPYSHSWNANAIFSDWDFSESLSGYLSRPDLLQERSFDFFGYGQYIGHFYEHASYVFYTDIRLIPVFTDISNLPASVFSQSSNVYAFVKSSASEGKIAVSSGESSNPSWVYLPQSIALSDGVSNEFIRITARHDYASGVVDIYVNGEKSLADIPMHAGRLSTPSFVAITADSENFTRLKSLSYSSLNPLFADSDNDGIPDAFVSEHSLSTTENIRYADADADGLSNLREYWSGTNPNLSDSDSDGRDDRRELLSGDNPLATDGFVSPQIPLSEDFENADYVSGTFPPNYLFGENTAHSILPSSETEGGKALEFTGIGGMSGSFEIYAQGKEHSEIWSDFRIAPQNCESQETPQTGDLASAAFYFSESKLFAYDGNAGEWISKDCRISGWRRVTISQNYQSKEWSLWVDGKMFFRGLGFANPSAFFQNMSLLQPDGQSCLLDDVSFSYIKPLGLDDDCDGIVNEEEESWGLNCDSPDSDNDGVDDLSEILTGGNPKLFDSTYEPLFASGSPLDSLCDFSQQSGFFSGNLNAQKGWLSYGNAALENERISMLAEAGEFAQIVKTVAQRSKNVWVGFDAILSKSECPDSFGENCALALSVNSSGVLCYYDKSSESWVETSVSNTDSEVPIRIDVHLNYVSKLARICVNGVSVAKNIRFNDSRFEFFSKFSAGIFASDRRVSAEIDNIRISADEPEYMDFDSDGLLNCTEVELGSDRENPDSNNDGIDDALTYKSGYNPSMPRAALRDLDGDGLSLADELALGLNPTKADTDSDGYSDKVELKLLSNPLDFDDKPSSLGIEGFAPYALGDMPAPDICGATGGKTVINTVNTSLDKCILYGRNISGNFRMRLRLDKFHFQNAGQRMGIYARESISDSAAMFGAAVVNNNQCHVFSRQNVRQIFSKTFEQERSEDIWIMIERKGERFAAYSSKDGAVWNLLERKTLEMPPQLIVGVSAMAITPECIETTAVFDSLSVDIDSDTDGIFDEEEAAVGTNPSIDDSDFDGISDYDEIHILHTNPVFDEFSGISDCAIPLNFISAFSEASFIDEQSISLTGSDVWFEFTSQAAVATPSLLAFNANFKDSEYSSYRVMEVLLNGRTVFCTDIFDTSGKFYAVLPSLAYGDCLKVRLLGGEPDERISVSNMNLEVPESDSWYSALLSDAVNFPDEDLYTNVSPAFIEWKQNVVFGETLTSDYAPENSPSAIDTFAIPHSKRFADIILNPSANTNVSFECGNISKSRKIIWTDTDLGLALTQPIILRKNSCLKFSVGFGKVQNGSVNILSPSGNTYASPISETQKSVFEFSEDGVYTVGLYDGQTLVNELSVISVSADLGSIPSIMRGYGREWIPASLPEIAAVETDENILLDEISEGGMRKFNLGIKSGSGGAIAARLNNRGAVLDVKNVNILTDFSYLQTKKKIVDTYPDGSKLWQIKISVGGAIGSDFKAVVQCWRGGVLSIDGSTEFEISASQFDASGNAYFYLIIPDDIDGSVCHNVFFYQGNARIK